jgi:hypothetical protein
MKTIKIHVTREDIALAEHRSQLCPIAQSLARLTGNQWTVVYQGFSAVAKELSSGTCVNLSLEAKAFMLRFDRNQPIEEIYLEGEYEM